MTTNDPVELPAEDVLVMSHLRNGVSPRATDIFIAVMGVTGSGKSSFIELLAEPDKEVPTIGHGLEGCTQNVKSYLYKYDDDTNVYLVDTPGFDDTNRQDSEVLKDIAFWLSESMRKEIKLSGIFYLHRISDPRMQGSARRNLLMFRKLCGKDALKNVILVTTMWDKVKGDEGDKREEELIDNQDFWGYMLEHGSRVERHLNKQESAKQLVSQILNQKKTELTIQNEMVRKKINLSQTEAGKTLDTHLVNEEKRWEKRATEQKDEMEEAIRLQDEELIKISGEECLKSEAKAKALSEEREKLKVNLEDLRMEYEKKMQTMLEAQQAQLNQKSRREIERTLSNATEELKRKNDEIKILKSSMQTRTRSHPGPNCIKEGRSISLVGDLFYFCGSKNIESNLPQYIKDRVGDQTFEDDSELQTDLTRSLKRLARILSWKGYTGGVKAYVLGTSDSFYIHYHQDGDCKDISFLPDYPELARFLDEHRKSDATGPDRGKTTSTGSGCPRYVSLGVNGHYYLRTNKDLSRNLPNDLVSQSWYSDNKVKAVWLGMKNAWVAQLKGGERRYNLQGQYAANSGKLEETIKLGYGRKRAEQRIEAMALNLTNPNSYACVWGSGGVSYNDADAFDSFIFEEFATKNFGTEFP